jgi:hypothetical protein
VIAAPFIKPSSATRSGALAFGVLVVSVLTGCSTPEPPPRGSVDVHLSTAARSSAPAPAPSASTSTRASPSAEECSALINTVNGGQDIFKIEPDETKMEAQAELVDAFASQIGEVEIFDRELRIYAGEYRDMVKDMAQLLRDVVAATPETSSDGWTESSKRSPGS